MIGNMSATAPLTYALKDEEDEAVKRGSRNRLRYG